MESAALRDGQAERTWRCVQSRIPLRSNRTGFTLVELLVVIAVIAVLAGILFPVFSGAREKARQTACSSNLRQIGLAIEMYAGDYDEWLPASDSGVGYFLDDPLGQPTVLNSIRPYVKSTDIYACPSASKAKFLAAPDRVRGDTNYAGNGVIFSDRGRPLAALGNPAGLMWMQEVDERNNAFFLEPRTWFPDGTYVAWHIYYDGREHLSNLHHEGGNLAFADQHAKWRPHATLRSGEFALAPNERWSVTNSYWPNSAEYYVESLQGETDHAAR